MNTDTVMQMRTQNDTIRRHCTYELNLKIRPPKKKTSYCIQKKSTYIYNTTHTDE